MVATAEEFRATPQTSAQVRSTESLGDKPLAVISIGFGSALASALCAVGAAWSAGSFPALWAWRALGGFCLAGVYPVGMKIAAQW